MKLQGLSVKGFRSFKKEQTLDLAKLPVGLYLVSGDNRVNPKLGGNGAGKSSFFEVFFWTMTGETSRGLRATSINSWGAKKGCETSINLDGASITRGWSPNYLRVDGEEVDQAQLMHALRLSPSIILNTVYFGQFAPFFLDLKPAARMEMYAEVLGLEYWEAKSEQTKDFAKRCSEELHQAQLELADRQSRVRTLEEENFTAQAEEWAEKNRANIRKLQRAKHSSNEAEHETKELLEFLRAQQKELRGQLKGSKAGLEARTTSREKLAARGAALEAEIRANRRTLKNDQQALAAFLDLGEGVCELCGQSITPKHKKAHTHTLKVSIESTEEVLRDLDFQHRDVLARYSESDLDTYRGNISRLERLLAKSAREEADAEAAAVSHSLAADRADEDIKRLRRLSNPFEALQQKAKKDLNEAKASAKEAQALVAELEKQLAGLTFWQKGFKDIRFQVIQESLVQLNAEVNEALHDIGLEGWKLEFSVEKETKSGSVKRGFVCAVHAPDSPEAVPWEAWSGGETQRLRLAAQFGVANMLSSRLGLHPDFEFWDEPSNWLNEGGIKDTLALLHERAQRYGRRIFLADHRSFDYDFDGVLHIVKTERGSELQPSWLP